MVVEEDQVVEARHRARCDLLLELRLERADAALRVHRADGELPVVITSPASAAQRTLLGASAGKAPPPGRQVPGTCDGYDGVRVRHHALERLPPVVGERLVAGSDLAVGAERDALAHGLVEYERVRRDADREDVGVAAPAPAGLM